MEITTDIEYDNTAPLTLPESESASVDTPDIVSEMVFGWMREYRIRTGRELILRRKSARGDAGGPCPSSEGTYPLFDEICEHLFRNSSRVHLELYRKDALTFLDFYVAKGTATADSTATRDKQPLPVTEAGFEDDYAELGAVGVEHRLALSIEETDCSERITVCLERMDIGEMGFKASIFSVNAN